MSSRRKQIRFNDDDIFYSSKLTPLSKFSVPSGSPSTPPPSPPGTPGGTPPWNNYASRPLPHSPVAIHPLLAFHPYVSPIIYDISLSPYTLAPNVHASPSSFPASVLGEPASQPSMHTMTLIIDQFPWRLTIPPTKHYISVRDLLEALYSFLRNPVTSSEYSTLPTQALKDEVSIAFHSRCERAQSKEAADEQYQKGVKRVDFLRGQTRFMGLSSTKVGPDVWVVNLQTTDVVNDTAESIVLDDMPYASGARFQREKGCLPGTRESLLQEICDTLNRHDDDAPRVCLLTGVAGSGKSAVAHSIAQLYDTQRRLGSSYHFATTDIANRNPKNLFHTVARDLSDHNPQFKSALWQVVRDDRALRTSQSPMEQLERLIIEPSKYMDSILPLVIVIDALDESGDPASRRPVLHAFSKQVTENMLPHNLRFLITARPETDILDALLHSPQVIHKDMGDIPHDLVDRDIETFIYHSLHEYTALESSWPDREWCRLLVYHSQHLFQWASTACIFVGEDGTFGLDPCERFEELHRAASTDGSHLLDKLFYNMLSRLFNLDDTRAHFRTVMAIVFTLHEPLSLNSLSTLLDGDLNIRSIIKHMASLLDGVLDEEKPIRPLHTSFRYFLLDEARSSVFHVLIQPQHSLLGRASLACMKNMLPLDISDAQHSCHGGTTPSSQMDKTIPPHLAYSCLYWVHHLQHVDHTRDLLDEIALFLKAFFLTGSRLSSFFPSIHLWHSTHLRQKSALF